MTYQAEVLADAPWGFWELSEDLAALVQSSGSDTTGWTPAADAEFGRPAIPAGSAGTAARGTTGIASRSSIPASLAGDNVTVECWFNMPASGTLKGSLMKIGSSGGDGWAVGLGGSSLDDAGRNIILLTENVAWHPTSVAVSGGDHHLVVVRGTGNAVTVYLDGASVWTGSLSSPSTPTAMSVGGYVNGASNRYLPNTVPMDEVAFYASALSGARVASHYNGGAGSSSAVAADSPVILLHLDDDTIATSFADGSGNGRALSDATGSRPVPGAGPVSGVAAAEWGVGGYVRTAATLAEPTTSTYEAWVYLEAAPGQVTPIITVAPTGGGSGNTSGIQIESDGRVTSHHYPSADLTSPTALSFNTWHHVISSTGADGSKLRVDKVTVASSATTSDLNAATGPVWLHGSYTGASIVSGGPVNIAMPAFWTSQLSDARTDAHYDAMAPSGATSSIALAGTLPAIQSTLILASYTDTDTANQANGRIRTGGFVDETVEPVAPLPANLVRAMRVDKAIAYPTPTLVDGRPT